MLRVLQTEDLVLETQRLTLRPFAREDQDIATQVLCDPKVMRYVADPETPESVAAHMSDAVKRGAGGRIGIWSITRKDTGQKIGDAVLMPVPIDEEDYDWSLLVPGAYPDAHIEVGYLLIPDAWGQGFATETCARMLRFAFEQTALDEIVATTDPDNAKSQHVLGKCGLHPLGLRRAYAWDDVSWFKITREDWTAQASNQ